MKGWATSTRANEFAGSVVLCLMTSLTPTLRTVSKASGSRSAADVLTLPAGARRLARRTDAFWQAAEQPAATVAQFAGHINLFPRHCEGPFLWHGSSARRVGLICISLLSGAGSDGEEGGEGRRVAPHHLGSVSSMAMN